MKTVGNFTLFGVCYFFSVLLMVFCGLQRYTLKPHVGLRKKLKRVWIFIVAAILAVINGSVFYSESEPLIAQRAEEFRATTAPSMSAEAVSVLSLLLLFVMIFISLLTVAFLGAVIEKSMLEEKWRDRNARRRTAQSTSVEPSNEPMQTTALDLPERVVVSTSIGGAPNMNTK